MLVNLWNMVAVATVAADLEGWDNAGLVGPAGDGRGWGALVISCGNRCSEKFPGRYGGA